MIVRSFEDVKKFVRGVYRMYGKDGFTHILGVSRGGIVPATMVSYYLCLPLLVTNYSSLESPRAWHPHSQINILHEPDFPLLADSKVLIIDEICDSGHTMMDLHNAVKSYCKCETAVIDCRRNSLFKPSFSLFEIGEEVVEYPWNLDVGL